MSASNTLVVSFVPIVASVGINGTVDEPFSSAVDQLAYQMHQLYLVQPVWLVPAFPEPLAVASALAQSDYAASPSVLGRPCSLKPDHPTPRR